jgi:hypothetical protein
VLLPTFIYSIHITVRVLHIESAPAWHQGHASAVAVAVAVAVTVAVAGGSWAQKSHIQDSTAMEPIAMKN